MKQLFLQKGKVLLKNVPPPRYSKHDVIVETFYSFISSGTEIATLAASGKTLLKRFLSNSSENIKKLKAAVKENGFRETVALIKNKTLEVMPLGYTCSGRVIAVGSKVDKFRKGDFVACGGAGFANHGEFVVVPHNLVIKLSGAKFLKQASLVAIGAIAIQGLRRANMQLGEKVCVIGLGLIGQLTVQLAKLSGLEVIGIDIDDARLSLAKKFGCDFVLNPLEDDIKKIVDFKTQHHGVDSTIITAAASSGEIIQQSMQVTRCKGKVVLVGDVKIDFDRNPFYEKEIDFLISRSYGPGRYDRYYEQEGVDYPYSYVRWTENRNMQLFVDLVEKEKLLIDPIISQEFDIDDAEAAYRALKEKKSLGVALSYGGEEIEGKSLGGELSSFEVVPNFTDFDIKPYIVTNGEVKVSIVGVGGFAKVKLFPILSKIKDVKIKTIVDIDNAKSINIASRRDCVAKTTNRLEDVLEDDINLVVISTPHKFHLEQTINCLKSGKAVFCEKPAAVTWEGFLSLKSFLNIAKNSLYCVDFNRSFAPFSLAIKKEIKKRATPLVVNYRMNSGFITKDHWVQASEDGGRIIGEACHIFELFCFLTGSHPVSVSVGIIRPSRDDLLATDNFSAVLSFADGSVCSLLYTALGSKEQSKERAEIFYDGKSIVMNDFQELIGYGLPSSFNKKTNKQNKGHENLLTRFIDAAKINGDSPISYERILLATKISLIVDSLASKGGGTCAELQDT